MDESLADKDGYYYPVTTTPLLLIGNAEYKDMPSDWTDLADENMQDCISFMVWKEVLIKLFMQVF